MNDHRTRHLLDSENGTAYDQFAQVTEPKRLEKLHH